MFSARYTGPLPPATEFEHYEKTTTGAGDRILRLAESEQSYRHDFERRQLDAAIADQQSEREQFRRGQLYGLTVALGALVVGGVIAVVGSVYESVSGTVVGGVVGSGGLASVILAFTAQRRSERQQDEEAADWDD